MPSLEDHKNKYTKNKELLTKELAIETCLNYDWIVTVAFYSALHLIEAEFAKNNLHNQTHKDRGVMIGRISTFNKVRNYYKFLQDRSMAARYSSVCMTKKKAEDALKYLSNIENEIEI